MLIGALLRAVLAREAWTRFPARCFWITRVMPGVSGRRYAPCGPSELRGRISITSSTLLMSPVSTFRRACGTISYSVMGSTARISSTPDVTPPLQRLTRLPSLSHPLPLVFCAHPILNSGCSVSCIAFCLPRVPSLLESLHLALVVFFLLLVVRVVLCPFQSGSFRSVLLNFRLQCEKLQGKNKTKQAVLCCGSTMARWPAGAPGLDQVGTPVVVVETAETTLLGVVTGQLCCRSIVDP